MDRTMTDNQLTDIYRIKRSAKRHEFRGKIVGKDASYEQVNIGRLVGKVRYMEKGTVVTIGLGKTDKTNGHVTYSVTNLNGAGLDLTTVLRGMRIEIGGIMYRIVRTLPLSFLFGKYRRLRVYFQDILSRDAKVQEPTRTGGKVEHEVVITGWNR